MSVVVLTTPFVVYVDNLLPLQGTTELWISLLGISNSLFLKLVCITLFV